MTEFDRKVEEASVRFNRSVANIAETLEKETVGVGDVSERRGSAGGANAFLEGAADGGGKAFPVRGLSGNAAQEFLNRLSFQRARPVSTTGLCSRLLVFLLPQLLGSSF